MTEKELYDLAEKYQVKADRAYQSYQETGITRYDRERRNAEELADALRMAAGAADDHLKLIRLKVEVSNLAYLAKRAKDDSVLLETLRQSLLIIAQSHGLIGKEEDVPCE